MSDISEQLDILNETKTQIRQAIEEKRSSYIWCR